MYRKVIEHPDWMPPELQHRPDQMEGSDRGRIYRIVSSADAGRAAAPKLSEASDEQLVAALAAPNSWRRETAARLLLERRNAAVAPLLRKTAVDAKSTLARIHAIWLLEGLSLGTDALSEQLLHDADPRVVEQAIVAADRRIGADSPERSKMLAFAAHDDPRVRLVALLTAQSLPAELRLPKDEWERGAMLIAANAHGGDALARALDQLSPSAAVDAAAAEQLKRLVTDLSRLAAASADERQHKVALESLLGRQSFGRIGLTSFLREAARRGKSNKDMFSILSPASRQQLRQVFANAKHTAADRQRSEDQRCDAIDLAALSGTANDAIADIALHDPSPDVRTRAIAALPNKADRETWRQLLGSYSTAPRAIRSAIIDGCLAHPERTAILLDEIAAGRIKPAALDAAQVDRLLTHRDPDIRQRAAQLAAAAVPKDRQQVLADYQTALVLPGDARRGRLLFGRHCAACHRIGDIGVNVAPDISDSRERTSAQYLTDILLPNRAIDANYFSYTAATVDGLTHTGVLSAETSTSITLKQAEGKTVTLQREEIEELRPNGVSLMPEGLERDISKLEMADLLAFIKNWRYLDGQTPLNDGS
jgi:putative heme-binding domain-containing protein